MCEYQGSILSSYIIPSASTVGVRALVSGEEVDQDTIIAVEVFRADTSVALACSNGRTVGLSDVEQLTGLFHVYPSIKDVIEFPITVFAYLVIPGAGSGGVCALVSGEDINEDTRIVEEIDRAGASTCTAGVAADENLVTARITGQIGRR